MTINELHLEGYGIFNDHRIKNLEGSLEVLYGENEAGKSTLLDFIRMTLMGYPRANADRRPPLQGGNHGGSLYFTDSSGKRWQVYRSGASSFNAPPLVYNLDSREEFQDERRFKQLIDNANEDILNNIYAIGLHELFEIESIDKSGMKDRIYSLGTGVSGLDLRALERGLEAGSHEIFKPRGSTQLIPKLAGEINELKGKLQEMDAGVEKYDELQSSRTELIRENELWSERIRKCDRELEKYSALRDVYGEFISYEETSEKLVEFKDFKEIPDEVEEEIKNLHQKMKSLGEKRDELEVETHNLTGKMAGLMTDEKLLFFLPQLDWLGATIPLCESWMEREKNAIGRVAQAKEGQSSLLQRMGLDLSGDFLREFTAFTPLRTQAGNTGKQKEELEKRAARMADRLEGHSRSIRELEVGIEELKRRISGSEIATDEQLQKSREELAKLESRFQEMLKAASQKDPVGILQKVLFGILAFILGVVAFSLFETHLYLALALVGGIVLLIFLAFAGGFSGKKEKNGLSPEKLQQRISELTGAIERREQLDREVEDKKSLLRNLNALKLEDEQSAQKIEGDLQDCMKQWQSFLNELGLPDNLQTSGVNDFCNNVERFQELVRSEREAAREGEDMRSEIEKFEKRVLAMARSRPNENLRATALRLKGDLENQKEIQAGRERLQEAIREKEAHLKALKLEIEALEEDWKKQIAPYSIDSETEFNQYVRRQAEMSKLQSVQSTARLTIESRCGRNNLKESLEAMRSTDPAELQQKINDLSQQKKELEDKLKENYTNIGSLEKEAHQLLDSDRQSRTLEELEILQSQMNDAYRQWISIRLAETVIGRCKARYQETRQPAVVQRTAEIFSAITSGRYTNVQVSLDDESLLVFDRHGSRKRVEELSRGTREQLLLSLRMGLIDQYESTGAEPLPVVLDDVLVNFDHPRATETARQLATFAKDRQVLLFTCHKSMAELMTSVGGRLVGL